MKYSVHLVVSIVLALNLSVATAGSHKTKSDKNPDTSTVPGQSTAPQGNKGWQQKPINAADHQDDNDWERNGDWESERDRERDLDSKRGQPTPGNERSEEMLERRDERKERKSEYRSDRVPGQEGRDNAPGQQGKPGKGPDDRDTATDDKKPWYKFWE